MSRLAFLALLCGACTRPNDQDITCDPNDLQCLATKNGGSTSSGGNSSTGGGNSGSTSGGNSGSTGSGGFDMGAQSNSGSLVAGSPCTSGSQCMAGTVCSGPTVNATKLCHQVCSSDADCKQATFSGGVAPLCVSIPSAGISVCSISCNPVGATRGCPSGFSCAVRNDVNRIPPPQYTDCIIMGTAPLGGDCTAHGITDCSPGLICIDRGFTDGSDGCAEVCDPAQSATCSDGTQCNPSFFETYGDCLF